MKLELIKTENYLVVVDDSEIKEGDIYIRVDNGILFATLKNSNPEIVKKHCKKIIAHLPLSYTLIKGAKMPTFTKIPLLPPLDVEDDVESMSFNPSLEYKKMYDDANTFDFRKGFVEGYNKAKENMYKVLGNEIKQITREEANFIPHFQSMNGEFFTIDKKSLSQPKTPTHFEFEMKCGRCYSTEPDNDCWSAKECSRGYDFDDIILTTTNAQGQEIACGKYIY